jgi:hypothetical protein
MPRRRQIDMFNDLALSRRLDRLSCAQGLYP